MRDFNRSFDNNRFPSRDSSKRSFGNKSDERPTMHPAVCASCGKNCEVPFVPSGNKDVFCRDCFDKQGGKQANFGRKEDRRFSQSYSNNFDRNRTEEFSAVCDKCGKTCTLPFSPSSNKPVFCKDCYVKRDDRGSTQVMSNNFDSKPKTKDMSRDIVELKDQIVSINIKLEKIMKALNVKSDSTSKPTIPNQTKKVTEIEKIVPSIEKQTPSNTEIKNDKVEVDQKPVKFEKVQKPKVSKKAVVKNEKEKILKPAKKKAVKS